MASFRITHGGNYVTTCPTLDAAKRRADQLHAADVETNLGLGRTGDTRYSVEQIETVYTTKTLDEAIAEGDRARNADHVDGLDRDDLGLSPDF